MFWRRKVLIVAPPNHGIKEVPKGYVLMQATDPDRVHIHKP